MKRQILLFTAIAGISYLTLTSYSSGPGAPPNSLNRTGGPGSGGLTCAQSGCHGAQTASSSVTFSQMIDNATGTPVSGNSYIAGHTYSITIGTFNTTLSKLGFQLEIVNSAGVQAGSIVATQNQTTTHTVGGISILEHTSPITASNHAATVTFTWIANGAAATGNLTIHAVVNWVNGDGVENALDMPSLNFTKTLTQVTSIADLSENIKILAFPNPATNNVNLKFEDAERGNYTVNIMDLTGRRIYSENVLVNTSTATTTIQTANWANGLYFAQIMKDGTQRMIPISKQ